MNKKILSAPLLQFMPPRLPGNATVPCTLGGVKTPSDRLGTDFSGSGRLPGPDREPASSALSRCGTSGGGASGNGCVGILLATPPERAPP